MSAAPNLLQCLAGLTGREFGWWARQPFCALALAIYPLVLLGVLAACFSRGVPEQLPVGVADLDHSTFSRGIVRSVDATQGVAVTLRAADTTSLRQAVLKGEIYAAVVLPADLERDAIAGARPAVAVFYDNQHMTAGGTALAAIRSAIAQQGAMLSADLLRQSGANPGPVSLNPVQSVSEVLFNPQRNYTYFLLVSLAPAVLQLFAAVAATVAVGREFKGSGPGPWGIAAGSRPFIAVAGKLAPYFLLLFLVAFVWFVIEGRALDVPFRGSASGLAIGTALFLLATLGAGAFIGALCPTLPQALAVCTLYVSPTFSYSGTAFPVSAMPQVARIYREFLPLSPYLELTVDQTIRGAPLQWSVGSLLQLALLAASFLLGTTLLLKRRWAVST